MVIFSPLNKIIYNNFLILQEVFLCSVFCFMAFIHYLNYNIFQKHITLHS
ncbi:hypothetical protein CHAB381_0792 [Campylobacter hominis ATCC BAA-381]|uniref:Uncharacterized protein n=1 Tax=Campylobacter hominis (strain ATCC BAA-381 / DSM 21671 / CCUG 45161 / LMG 19568 / NCTC 13146 / CH001A) TaxID=360107 RepID=A7I1H2_CAMHC|nr:hypothetical protein CHAB381_0792 [Campylobacter hominis ATCC BAA-381]